MECKICLSAFTKDLRKEIECPYCHEKLCCQCLKTVLLESPRDPKCPNCFKGFTPDFLDATFSKGFRRGDLRKKQIEVLLDLEKSLLPQASEVLRERKREQDYKAAINSLRVMCNRMIDTLEENERLPGLLEKARSLRTTTERKEKTVRTVKCPNCRGYIAISKTGTCDLCSYKMCRSCGSEAKEHHVCEDDAVKSFQYMKDNYKACPKCGIFMERVSGCNQMFCVSCHTAFDWVSLKITSGPIHNPHYFEFMRNRNLDLVANACNEAVIGHDMFPPGFETKLRRHPCWRAIHGACSRPDCLTSNFMLNLWRSGNWIIAEAHEEPQEYTDELYLEYRISYLQNTLSEKDWKTKLSFRETHRLKKNRLLEIQRMFAHVVRDLGTKVFTDENYVDFFKAMNELRVYVFQAKKAILQDFSDKVLWHYGTDWSRVQIALT